LPDDIGERILAHLTNLAEFWGEYVIPSVARNDPHYDPETMWRGPVRVNINYIFIAALHQVGEHDLAHTLLERTLVLLMSQPGIYEYCNAETGKPSAVAADAFGWTAAVSIDQAVQASRKEQNQLRGGSYDRTG
jgi:glycogen debranching enzyme